MVNNQKFKKITKVSSDLIYRIFKIEDKKINNITCSICLDKLLF